MSESRTEQAEGLRNRGERARDVTAIALSAMAVFAILALSGALGWVEAATACIVMVAGTMAYYVGSTAPERPGEASEGAAGEGSEHGEIDLQALLSALPFPSLHVAANGRIDAANDGARDVFRIRAGQRSLAAAVIRQPTLIDAIERTQATGFATRLEYTAGGTSDQVWRAHVAPFSLGEGGVLVVLEDLTEARRAEQARADFLANASHELRTPLTSLAGFIETMRGPARNDKDNWDRFLDIMFEQTERMRRLIADLLSLSRIEFSEHQPPDRVEDIALILHGIVQAMRPVAAERDVAVVYEGPEEGLEAVAVADEMAQVAQNLLSNAIKYSDDGGRVRVSCGLERSLEAGRSQAGRRWSDAHRMTIIAAGRSAGSAAIWLRVEDDGPGIEREHLPRLGQRFYRVDESRGGEITGTGLGLAIVKHIMARHRGGLIVESRPGHGSAFGVWLPALSRPKS